MQNSPPLSRIIRPAQAARLLGISRATLYRWERAGRLAPRVILGPGTSGWREDDLAAFIAAAPRGGVEPSIPFEKNDNREVAR